MKVLSIIKNGRRVDIPETGMPTMFKYGTPEGAQRGWDTRGRGNKEAAPQGKDKPKGKAEARAYFGSRKLGDTHEQAMELVREVRHRNLGRAK